MTAAHLNRPQVCTAPGLACAGNLNVTYELQMTNGNHENWATYQFSADESQACHTTI